MNNPNIDKYLLNGGTFHIYDLSLGKLFQDKLFNIHSAIQSLISYHIVDWIRQDDDGKDISLQEYLKSMSLIERLNFLLEYGHWDIIFTIPVKLN